MKRLLAALVLGFSTSVVHGAEATITIPNVEVRAGPSDRYYVTAQLRQGEHVQVMGKEKNGFLPIAPPAGSFSYIDKDSIEVGADHRTGTVKIDDARLRVGSALNREFNVSWGSLDKGTPVTILDEATLTNNANVYRFYKIAPVNEVRYLPAHAIKPVADEPDKATSPPTNSSTSSASADATKVQAAYRAYVQGQSTGDYTEAKKLYDELTRSSNPETRTMALNYKEYIRRLEQSPPVRGNANRADYSRAPLGSPPRATSSYTYAKDTGPVIPASGQSDRIPPTKLPDAPTPAATNPTTKAQKSVGTLQVSGRGSYKGHALYVLTNSRGEAICSVVSTLANLAPFANRAVELTGTMAYDKELRMDLMTVTEVKNLADR